MLHDGSAPGCISWFFNCLGKGVCCSIAIQGSRRQGLYQTSRYYFGCCSKSIAFFVGNGLFKGLRFQADSVRRPGISDDFWSTSTWEMDNSGLQPQRSISSINTSSIQVLDQHGAGNVGNLEFVNHGLLLWNQTREQWVGNRTQNHKQPVQEPRLSWNATYDSLLGTNKPFPLRIPLPEMVDFLVDEWEQEGLYD